MKRLAEVALVNFSYLNVPILSLKLWNELKTVTNGKDFFRPFDWSLSKMSELTFRMLFFKLKPEKCEKKFFLLHFWFLQAGN